MSVTTIEVIVTAGSETRAIHVVGDPTDALFAVQVGNTVGHILLEIGPTCG